MAYNQASFFLFAPGVGPIMETVEGAVTSSGDSVSTLSFSSSDSAAPQVFTTALRQWFMDRGFARKGDSEKQMFRGTQPTPFGMEDEIVVWLSLDEDQVTGLYMRFLLTKQTPEQIPEWTNLILALGHDFGFQIMGANHELLPCSDFLGVLVQNYNFLDFKKAKGWVI
ncbi:hypothetical protein OKA04_10900 [Luteolibacter flavescens]|uniref:Uncharacterized protein n=1 Tax=Luteolibacter flavescens TaxID=1859460 RepID=A0ABT3FNU2_9BACT|nr:hypothetical protein [Luteolibacter flavescens]MCW1885237.1 hypothetical protein [Luteolibacter flavescens]